MLEIATHNLGNATIFQCRGGITVEHAHLLRMTVLKHVALRTAVLDLTGVTAIDAAGVGILVALRWWARTTGTRLKLMNLTVRS